MTRAARRWVYGLVVVLSAFGLTGLELWPLTSWRLFSLSRTATQIEWALDAVLGDEVRTVDLDELPLAYRNAAWQLEGLDGAPVERREAVCEALLGAVVDLLPDASGLRLVRVERHMRSLRGDPATDDLRAVVHTCRV